MAWVQEQFWCLGSLLHEMFWSSFFTDDVFLTWSEKYYNYLRSGYAISIVVFAFNVCTILASHVSFLRLQDRNKNKGKIQIMSVGAFIFAVVVLVIAFPITTMLDTKVVLCQDERCDQYYYYYDDYSVSLL